MNINLFFTFIIGGLAAILILFRPTDINNNVSENMALIELNDIKITEINKEGLLNIMMGSRAVRYTQKYVIDDLDYTDNANKYLTNIRAKNAVYQDGIFDLEKDIIYSREDGLSFQMQKARYIKKQNIVESPESFIAYMNDHRAEGSSFIYNNELKSIKAKNVSAVYQLEESKK